MFTGFGSDGAADQAFELGQRHRNAGKLDLALQAFTEGLRLAEIHQDLRLQAKCWGEMGMVLHDQGALEPARDAYEHGEQCARQAGDADTLAACMVNLGGLLIDIGCPEVAQRRFEEALRLTQDNKLVARQALCLNHLGGLQRQRGQLEQALETFGQAVLLATHCGDFQCLANAHNGIGVVHMNEGRVDAALESYQQALEAARRARDRLGQGEAHYNIGAICRLRGALDDALAEYHAALDLAEQAGYLADQAFYQREIADIEGLRYGLERARAGYAKALSLAEASGALDRQASCLLRMGSVELHSGAVEMAQDYVRRALDLAQRSENLGLQSACHSYLGGIYHQLGQLAQALNEYQHAHQLSEQAGIRQGQILELTNVGSVLEELDLDQALAVYQRAQELAAGLDDPELSAQVQNNIGNVYERRGEDDTALRHYQDALVLATRAGRPDDQATYATNVGRMLHRQGKVDDARDHYRRALAQATRFGDIHAHVDALARLGDLETPDRPAVAYEYYRQAIKYIETVRSQISSAEHRLGFFVDYAAIYPRMALVCARLNLNVEAFTYAERGRSRAFLDALGSSRYTLEGSVPADELRPYRTLRTKIDQLLHYRDMVNDNGHASAELVGSAPTRAGLNEQLEVELARTFIEIDQELERLAQGYPDFGACQTVMAPEVSHLQTYLRNCAPPNTAIVEFVIADGGLMAFVLTNNALRGWTYPATSLGDVETHLFDEHHRYRLEVDPSLKPLNNLLALRLSLITPLEAQGLLDEIEHLWIVPTGPLHFVPWSALNRRVRGQRRFLVQDYQEIAVLPAAGVLPFCQQHREQASNCADHLYAVASPDPDNPLPFALPEVQQIARLYPEHTIDGSGTTREVARVHSQRRGVLHFAQHAVFDPELPQSSGLEFADGRVTLNDLLNDWRLQSELVVLSSCHSARATVSSGDEVLALTRGVIHAGSAAVLASLYSVQDPWVPPFMATIHECRRSGLRTAEALARAQREAIEHGDAPRLWAPFMLIGDA